MTKRKSFTLKNIFAIICAIIMIFSLSQPFFESKTELLFGQDIEAKFMGKNLLDLVKADEENLDIDEAVGETTADKALFLVLNLAKADEEYGDVVKIAYQLPLLVVLISLLIIFCSICGLIFSKSKIYILNLILYILSFVVSALIYYIYNKIAVSLHVNISIFAEAVTKIGNGVYFLGVGSILGILSMLLIRK